MRHEIIERAQQILEETNVVPVPERELDPVERWRREGNELAAARDLAKQEQQQVEREITERQTQDWQGYFERRIEERIGQLVDAIGDVIAHERRARRAELAKLKAELTARVPAK